MFEALIARAAALAATAAARRRRRIAVAAANDVPRGVALEEGAEAIILSGRALTRRRVRDAQLRAFVESLR
jgi:hypothetical protein